MLKWYVVTIILKCEVAGMPTNPGEWTCIEQIHLIRGSTRDGAFEKALAIGRSQETSYKNVEGKIVDWKFVGLENVEELDSKVVRDGIEIWGRVLHTEDPEALITDKEGLSVFFTDEIKNLSASEILGNGFETKLVCNRVRI